jgi:hypothetical protein
MRTVFAALIFAATLSSCALFKPEPWATQVFTPSKQSENKACDRGAASSSNIEGFRRFGYITFKPKSGELSFNTKLGRLSILCLLLGSISREFVLDNTSFLKTNVRILDSTVKRELITVEIALEQDGQQLIRLQGSPTTTEEPNETEFEFQRLSPVQQTALETANSFTIIVKRGSNEEERYAVNQSNLPWL